MLFPQARRAIVTSDTLWSPGEGRGVRSLGREWRGRHHHRYAARHQGLSFPQFTLVGVIDADLGLEEIGARRSAPSSRSARSRGGPGVAKKTGCIHPDAYDECGRHEGATPAIRSAFILPRRRAATAEAPPFGASPRSSSPAKARVSCRLHAALAGPLRNATVCMSTVPAPAPLAQLRGRYRHRLLVHRARGVNVQGAIRQWLGRSTGPHRCGSASTSTPIISCSLFAEELIASARA